jgi:hypothetical protein
MLVYRARFAAGQIAVNRLNLFRCQLACAARARHDEGMDGNAPRLAPANPFDDLHQVDGVLGSMLVSADGELLVQRLPAPFDARAAAAAPRLAVLLDALAAGHSIHGFCLRFFEHRLHVLPVAGSFLCVLSELWSPSPVLKMAMNVTGRRLQ